MKRLDELETSEEAEELFDQACRHYPDIAARIKAGKPLSPEEEQDSHVIAARAAYALMQTLPCAPKPASEEDVDLEVA